MIGRSGIKLALCLSDKIKDLASGRTQGCRELDMQRLHRDQALPGRTSARLRLTVTILFTLAVTLGGGTLTIERDTEALESNGAIATQNREAAERYAIASREAAERDAILTLVRNHRRGASEEWRQTLADAIYDESVAAAIDPLMVASIVARESSFKSRVVSRHGAVGLMQLRPFVAEEVAGRGQVDWQGRETLMSPSLNVRLGILYYQELIVRFDGDSRAALTAYNYGPTRVSRQIRDGVYNGSDYADRIIALYSRLDTKREQAS